MARAHASTSLLAIYLLTCCDMRVLYLRNVPDSVGEKLERLAAREGMSVSAFATRALAAIARRADNPALLADLPDVGVDAADIVTDVEAGRSTR
jgi:plasmid stability protein